ncbi:ribonuclease H-like domain-containing protein [Aspergillus varians]
MAKRKAQHDPSYTDDSGSSPPSMPNTPQARRRGHRFDEAVAARKERIQASLKIDKAQAQEEAKATKKAKAEALDKIAEAKKDVAAAKAEARAWKEKARDAMLETVDIGFDWDDNEAKRNARRMLTKAEAAAAAAEAQAVDKIAVAQALAAELGHPNAVEDGRWSILDEKEQRLLLGTLNEACHQGSVLKAAGFPAGKARAPRPDPHSRPRKKVVSLDCEFVGVGECGYSVLAQLCAVDVLTGKVLLDVLVEPGDEVWNYRTKHSGLTARTFERYREKGLVLADPAAVREALFKHIDRDTILVGFSLHNDLQMLEVSHYRVVDFQLVAKGAVESIYNRDIRPRRWGLQWLCMELMHRMVQQSPHGHDCLEDAFAPRELLVWWLDSNNEDAVRDWVHEEAHTKGNYYAPEFLELHEFRLARQSKLDLE